MQRVRVLGSALGAMLITGACASVPSTTAGGPLHEVSASRTAPEPRATSRTLSPAERDSLFAQLAADREGPRVTIRADLTSYGGSRRVRGNFHLEDDAYVLVGQIDANGVLRVVFPADPADNGFVKSDNSYQTNEFFAGFTDQFRYRAQNALPFRAADAAHDSYDGGLGVMFVVASWRPMRFDRFATDGRWDSFELSNEDFLRDPRPPVHELASLLAGDNREAYTVKFASYFNTLATTGIYNAENSISGYNAYAASLCPGSALGFAFSPLLGFGYSPSSFYGTYGYGSSFVSRGSNYYYNAAGDCYNRGSAFGAYGGYRIVQGPIPTPGRARTFDVGNHKPPVVPPPVPRFRLPATGTAGTTGTSVANGDDASSANPRPHRGNGPEYRQRGLIATEQDPAANPRARARQQPDGSTGAPPAWSRPAQAQTHERTDKTEHAAPPARAASPRSEPSKPSSSSPRGSSSPSE